MHSSSNSAPSGRSGGERPQRVVRLQQRCSRLSKVLSKVSTRDLNNFSVQIHRIGNKDWNNITTNDEITSTVPDHVISLGEEATSTYIQNVMKRQYSWTARLELQYEVNV